MIRLLLVSLSAAALLHGCSARVSGTRDANWDRDAVDEQKSAQQERAVSLPPYPRDADLLEFDVVSTPHRYFVDAKSIDVGNDGVVRYTLVVRTAGGAANASYEGIRCASYEKRIYALGHPQRKWIEARRSVWESIDPTRTGEYQDILYKNYFCPDRAIVANRDDAVRALRNDMYRPRQGVWD